MPISRLYLCFKAILTEVPFAISRKNLSRTYGKKQLAREENSIVLWDRNQSGNGEINLGLKYFVFFTIFAFLEGQGEQSDRERV